jgi:multidrug efflux pump subunit AcrB
MASSLTTVAAFIPLMLIGGTIGNILFEIPLVMVCVLIASLVESFLVLPGHLHHALRHQRQPTTGRLRQHLDRAFDRFRDRPFRALVERAVRYRWTTLAAAGATLILCAGLVAGGRMNFTFFPSPENSTLYASASFVAGSPPQRVRDFLDHLQETLHATAAEFGGNLIVAAQTRYGESQIAGGRGGSARGDQHGSMMIELTPPDAREVRMNEFIRAWRARIQSPPGLETLLVFSRTGGPPGRDVDIRLVGDSADSLKAAAQELAQSLGTLPGVSAIEDDMPYGSAQLIYRMTPLGEALGLTVEEVGRQLRAAYDGALVQIFQDGEEEVEVRVALPDAERHRLTSLDGFNVILPGGQAAPLGNVVELRSRQGFEALRHAQGRLAVQVSADVDSAVNNAGQILSRLQQAVLPELCARYGVDYSFEGRSADQAETLGDMRQGALLGLALIYIILAWVFASYGWPLVVMTAIPFGIVGAIVGHWLLSIDLTILSLFGVFGLSGIVVNDSIILVTFYQELRAGGMAVQQALVEAACQRLRAVLLTSLTTIGGLLPLLFETSLQAQFLIPMAVSLCFGLGFATLLVLFFVPALLSVYESAAAGWRGAAFHPTPPPLEVSITGAAVTPEWLAGADVAVQPADRLKVN